MNLTEENSLSCFDKSLQTALAQQVDEQYKKIRLDCLSQLSEKIQKKIKDLEEEHSTIVTNDIAEKAELLSKKFVELDKQYENATDERRIVEMSSKTARMRYDKLNVRFMNSGLRINQLKPRVEQMDPNPILEKSVQAGIIYSKSINELQDLLKEIKNAEECCDELKTRAEFARNDEAEFKVSLKEAENKFKRESEIIAQHEKEYSRLNAKIEDKMPEVEAIMNKVGKIKLKIENVQERINEIDNLITEDNLKSIAN